MYQGPDVISYLKQQGITKLYHFTDRANIQSIINNGGLYSWKACENKGIKIMRPGGSPTSRSLDAWRGLENYVRLSFNSNHPMMYVAKNDGRISDPVILTIDLSVAGLPTTKFSDRNATKNGAIIATGYGGAKNIHFSTVKQRDHFNLPVDEKEYYQAEVLVLEKIPLNCILNIDHYRLPFENNTFRKLTTSGRLDTPQPRPSFPTTSSSNSNSSDGCGCWIVVIVGIIIAIIIAVNS